MENTLEYVFERGVATNGDPLVIYFLTDRYHLPQKEEMFKQPQWPNATVVVVDTNNGTTVHFASGMGQSCVEVLKEMYPEAEGDAYSCSFPRRVVRRLDLCYHLQKELTLTDHEKMWYLGKLTRAEDFQRVACWAIPYLIQACEAHFTSGVKAMQGKLAEALADGGGADMDEWTAMSMASDVLGVDSKTEDEEGYGEE